MPSSMLGLSRVVDGVGHDSTSSEPRPTIQALPYAYRKVWGMLKTCPNTLITNGASGFPRWVRTLRVTSGDRDSASQFSMKPRSDHP